MSIRAFSVTCLAATVSARSLRKPQVGGEDYCDVDTDCDAGSYCLNDDTKEPIPVFFCHGNEVYCTEDSDCSVDSSSYCMNGPGKQPVTSKFRCHAPSKPVHAPSKPVFFAKLQEPSTCDTDDDCKSYCDNDPTKTPPYTCHAPWDAVGCNVDADCKSYCMDDPTKQPPYDCHPPPGPSHKPSLFSPEVHHYCSVDADCTAVDPTSYCENSPDKQPVEVWNCHGDADSYCHDDADCDPSTYCQTADTPVDKYFCH